MQDGAYRVFKRLARVFIEQKIKPHRSQMRRRESVPGFCKVLSATLGLVVLARPRIFSDTGKFFRGVSLHGTHSTIENTNKKRMGK